MKRHTPLAKMDIDKLEPLTRDEALNLLQNGGKVCAPVEGVDMGIKIKRRLLCPLTGTEYIDGEQVAGTFATALVLDQILVRRDDRRKGMATNAIQWLVEIAASLGCSFVRIDQIISPGMERVAQRCGFTKAYTGVYDYVV